MIEKLNQARWTGKNRLDLNDYRTQRGSFIDFELDGQYHLFSEHSTPDRKERGD